MRLRTRNVTLAFAALAVTILAVPAARAQAPVPLEGTVYKAGSREPVAGATVDIYRTDIKGKYETKTNKTGVFSYPVPQQGTYSIIVSGPGLGPQYQANVRPSLGTTKIEFNMPAGGGQRPTLDDVLKALKGGGEDSKAAEERAKAEEEHAKALAEKEKFDARKVRFDAGVAAMQNKDYNTAVTELTAAVEGLEGADPQFYAELGSVGGSNLAEVHYRMAVDLYNQAQAAADAGQKQALKDQAKQHLEAGAKAAALAVKFDGTKQVNYLIQGKILLLLADRYGATDVADTGAGAYMKAVELETVDPKKKVTYLVDAGDVYRAAYMTDKAIDAYKQALALDATNAQAYYGIGLAAMAASDEAKQKEYYQTAADYLGEYLKKAPANDQHVSEVKGLLDTLAGPPYKIKPRAIK